MCCIQGDAASLDHQAAAGRGRKTIQSGAVAEIRFVHLPPPSPPLLLPFLTHVYYRCIRSDGVL